MSDVYEYTTPICRVRVSGMRFNGSSWRRGRIVVVRDQDGVWKIRVEQAQTRSEFKPYLSPMRLYRGVCSESFTRTTFRCSIMKDSIRIIAEPLEGSVDTDYIDSMKTIHSILKKQRVGEDPSSILGISNGKVKKYEAEEVVSHLTGEDDDDEPFLTSQKSEKPLVAPMSFIRSSPSDARRRQKSYSRSSRILNTSLEVERVKTDNKENKSTAGSLSEQESAKSFYGSPGSSKPSNRSTLHGRILDMERTQSSNVRRAPSKFVPNYSMNRKPGLLPMPTPGSAKPAAPLKQAVIPFSSSPLQGFSNIGNTCYLNAILQSLLNLMPFKWDLMHNMKLYKYIGPEDFTGLYVSLLKLMKLKESRDSSRVKEALKSVKNAISSSAKRFSGYEQHDAHEFLAQVLDQLNEEVRAAEKSAIASNHKWVNPTRTNFELEVLHTIKCQRCNAHVTKEESIYFLSVDMPEMLGDQPGSIQTAVDTFFKPENLEYKCESCQHGESVVSHLIKRLPRVLVIHLKRYSFDTSFQVNNKLAQSVFIPKYVTLVNYCQASSEETVPPKVPVNPELSKYIVKYNDSDEAVVPEERVTPPKLVESKPVSPLPDLDPVDDFFPTPRKQEHDEIEKACKLSEMHYQKEQRRKESKQRAMHPDAMTEEEQMRLAMQLSMKESGCDQRDEFDALPSKRVSPGERISPWKRISPGKGSLDSELERADITGSFLALSESPIKFTPTNDDGVVMTSSPRIKRRRYPGQTLSTKMRKTDNNLSGTIFVESDTEDPDSYEVSDLPDSTVSVGLKGGALPSSEYCASCGQENSLCTCSTDDTELLSVSFDERYETRCPYHLNESGVHLGCIQCHRQRKAKKLCMKDQSSKVIFSNEVTSTYNRNSRSKPAVDVFAFTESPERIWQDKPKLRFSSDRKNATASFLSSDIAAAKKASWKDNNNVSNLSEEEQVRKALQESLAEQKSDDDDLMKAIKASLQENHVVDDELEKAKKISLKTLNSSSSTDDERPDFVSKTKSDPSPRTKEMEMNAEKGRLPNSYVLVGVVSHLGSTASFGHYIADVYDASKKEWLSYDDSTVTSTTLRSVREGRRRKGYIFFYMATDVVREVDSQLNHPLLQRKDSKLKERSANVSTGNYSFRGNQGHS